jgi:rare lipoprotein A
MAVFAAAVAAASSAQAVSGGVATSSSAGSTTWTRSVATWYGPGFFGNRTACGQTLKRRTTGVAHKKLPCGTKVTFAYRGRVLRTQVIDRGPYAHGARWDLTQATAKALRFKGTDKVRASVVR